MDIHNRTQIAREISLSVLVVTKVLAKGANVIYLAHAKQSNQFVLTIITKKQFLTKVGDGRIKFL